MALRAAAGLTAIGVVTGGSPAAATPTADDPPRAVRHTTAPAATLASEEALQQALVRAFDTAAGGGRSSGAGGTTPSTDSGCGSPSATPVVDGTDIVVTLDPAAAFTVGKIPASAWRSPAVTDPSWRLSFEGFLWMPPLAQRAADDGQRKALALLVDQLVRFHKENPDPKTPTYGWDEGTALRRLTVVNCLYALTKSRRLPPLMSANVAVLVSNRYYGPPRFAVHNHGLMANLAMLRAAQLTSNTTWRDKAIARMRSESALAFTKAGTSWEQSSGYQKVNVDLWNAGADAIATVHPKDAAIAAIRTTTARAARVFAWLTEPDGKIVIIGDAESGPGTTRSTWTARRFRDDQAGLGIGRWSWTDPSTTYYSVRYGPPRRAHGHEDRTGVTWSTQGVRVLVNPGLFTYDTTSRYLTYQRGPAGHNVPNPTRARLDTKAAVTVTAMSATSTRDTWRLADKLWGIAHARSITVDHARRTLVVGDSFANKGTFVQKWHLDPAWTLRGISNRGRTGTFTHPDGRTLRATSTGALSVARGSTRPVAGWHFPAMKKRVAACEITVSARAAATTTFVVS